MNVRISTPSGNRNRISGFLRLFIFSLLLAVFAFTTLHAQTRVYVPVPASNTVSVIDASTNTVTATIPVGNNPSGVVVSPDGARAYVSNGDDTLSVIDTGANTVAATIPCSCFPGFAAITPDGKSLYLPTVFSSEVLVISTASNSVVGTITTPGNLPFAAVATPDGSRVYVLATPDFLTGSVLVVDTATNTVVQSIPVNDGPGFGISPDITISPSGANVYVTGVSDSFADSVQVISTASNTVTATIPLGSGGDGIAVSRDGTKVYVAELFPVLGVGIIDTATNTLEASTIGLSGRFPFALGVTPDGASLYVANGQLDNTEGTVSVVSTATNTVTAEIPIGLAPFALAISNLNAPFASFPAPTPGTVNNPNKINLSGSLSLGANSQGLDFAHQPMTLTVGGFSLLFPAGTITQVGNSSQQHFTFSGALSGLSVTFDLIGNSPNFSYSFTIKGKNVATQVGPNPVTVSLAIGNNSGSSTVNF